VAFSTHVACLAIPPTAVRPYHWANTALYCYFLAVLAWAPLPLASNRDWSTRLLAGLLLAGLLGAVILWLLRQLRVTPALRGAWLPLAALVAVQVWVGMQLALDISVAPESTRQALLLGCALVAAFVLVLVLVDSRERVLLTTQVMVLCGVFQAFFAGAMMMSDIEQISLLDKIFDRNSASGTFINRNHLAGFLEMNLAIMVIALVLTRSRMGNSACFSSQRVCGALGLVFQRRVTRNTVIFFASLLLIDMYIVGSWFGVSEVVERLQNTTLAGDHRDEVAIDSFVMWRDHFWAGTGADTFFQAYVDGGYMSPDSLYYRHAHNDYLEVGTGFGFIGFSLLGAAVLASLRQALLAQKRRHSRVLQGLGFASAMGITSILIHSFADFNLHIPANSLWFVVILAFAWVAGYAREGPETA
jgi:O-antigen ligase